MQDESARTDAGFNQLPDIGEPTQGPTTNFDVWGTADSDPVHPPLHPTPTPHRNNPPPPHNPPPVTHTAATPPMTDATLAAMRLCLPNLKGLPDDVMRHMDPLLLIQLNNGAQAQPVQTPDAAAMAAAAAAHFAQSAVKSNDPGVKMAKALEKLRANPITVPAGPDDRISVLHVARFLPGTVLSAKKQWLLARDILGLDGMEPLSTYDMGACGLQGTVTMKGWFELGNPGSMNLCLKHFSPSNIGTSAGYSRRFSLAEGESAINVGDDFKEIGNMECFQQAMRAMCHAARMAMSWNYSFAALDNFIVQSKYGLTELAGCHNKVAELTNFVNHVLGVNAQNWITKECFLTAPELKGEFAIWAQNRPTVPAPASTVTAAGSNNQQHYNKSWGRGRGSGRGGYQPNYTSSNNSGQQGGGRQFTPSGRGRGNQLGRGGGGGNSVSSTMLLCKNYNRDSCNNHYSSCFLHISGDRAYHRCSAQKADGTICHGYHPATQHH
jgi:hypothetical protein